jgi:hypothetical protein
MYCNYRRAVNTIYHRETIYSKFISVNFWYNGDNDDDNKNFTSQLTF